MGFKVQKGFSVLFCSLLFLLVLIESAPLFSEGRGEQEPSLYYWQTSRFKNFGDFLSLKLVERILQRPVHVCQSKDPVKKFLAIGSLLPVAREGDILWGTGMNGKRTDPIHFKFKHLDIRAVRGPMTRDFLQNTLGVKCPEVYGDPGLLVPIFFPEFEKPSEPENAFIFIPHYSEREMFPKDQYPYVVYPTDDWEDIIKAILNSRFVISSSLHGIIVAEAYGIPSRYFRVTENEPLFKYYYYYLGTGRPDFKIAYSIEEALEMGGEPPINCDLQKLIDAFPYEYWNK